MVDTSFNSLPGRRGKSKPGTRTAAPKKGNQSTTIYVIFSLLALLVACVISTITILVKSHKTVTDSWRLRPAILVSVISSVFIISLGALFATGVTIAWWRSLAQGTTLKRLHYVSAGALPSGFYSALRAGGPARTVMLTAFIILLVRLAVGPFSQRATRVEANTVERDVEMKVRLANQIPDGWFGVWETFASRGTRASQQMFKQANLTTLNDDGYFCAGNGTCTGSATGSGFNYRCTSESTQINLLDPNNVNRLIFDINFGITWESKQPIFTVNTTHISSIDENCTGTLTTEICQLMTATVRYPITIENNIIHPEIDTFLDNPNVVANFTTPGDEIPTKETITKPIGSLLGLYIGCSIFRSNATLYAKSTTGVTYSSGSGDGQNFYWPNIYVDTSDATNSSNYKGKSKEICPLLWESPMRPMLRYIFDFTFRSAFAAAAGEGDKHLQRFPAVYRGTELWFMTDFAWLGVTVGIMVLGIFAAGVLLWGFWELGRYVTLAPVETAKALGAPVLKDAGGAHEADEIVDVIGREHVQYRGGELVCNGRTYATGARSLPSNMDEEERGDGDSKSILRNRTGVKEVAGFERRDGYKTVEVRDEDESMDLGGLGSRGREEGIREDVQMRLMPGGENAQGIPSAQRHGGQEEHWR